MHWQDIDTERMLDGTRHQLNHLVGVYSEHLGGLSKEGKSILEDLEKIQAIQVELQHRYAFECYELQKKYHSLQKPLYERIEDLTSKKILAPQKTDPDRKQIEEIVRPLGIPDFWLHVLTHHFSFHEAIAEHDQGALRHLVNLRLEYLESSDKDYSRGYKLFFEFSPNAYFENQTLTKTYRYKDNVGFLGELVYDSCTGTKIMWKEGMNLTEWWDSRGHDSFFNFFKPPIRPVLSEVDDNERARMEDQLEEDFQLGEDLKDQILPYAVHWFTGQIVREHGVSHASQNPKKFRANLRESKGLYPLVWAAELGYDTLFRALLEENSADVNVQDERGWTPLSTAAGNGHLGVVNMLLHHDDRELPHEKGVDINLFNEDGTTPLHNAAKYGHDAVVKRLLECPGIKINLLDNSLKTPLIVAAAHGHAGIVQLLLSQTAIDVHLETRSGRTAFTYAAQNGHHNVVRVMLADGRADPYYTTDKGESAIVLASRFGYDGVVKLILQKGITPKETWTALMEAAGFGHETTVRLLLDQGTVDINHQDRSGLNVLFVAARGGHTSIVKRLLEYGRISTIDVNLQTNDGWTSLAIAAANGSEGIVKLLLDVRDINIYLGTKEGKTPFSYASSSGHSEIAKLLWAHYSK